MWQHLAHRQEKINANLDSLTHLMDTINGSGAADYLEEEGPESKKRLLEAGGGKEEEDKAKRQKQKMGEEQVSKQGKQGKKGKKEKVASGVPAGGESQASGSGSLKYETFDNTRFDSNVMHHMVKESATAIGQRVPQVPCNTSVTPL
jgi:hypothetical protein